MEFLGLVLKFKIEEGESLKPLVDRGYSKPPSKDEIILKRELTEPFGLVEVHKKNETTLMVLVKPRPTNTDAPYIVGSVAAALNDLEEVGLLEPDAPF